MEIQEIKSRLNIIEVANELGITINKDGKAICPFHDDKNPSLQFSKEKQICTCFSGRCDVGTMDVVGLTERKLQLSTHEALKYLKGLNSDEKKKSVVLKTSNSAFNLRSNLAISNCNYEKDFEVMQSSFLNSVNGD